jgi:predicted DNA-binding protein with PD1-like motif
MNAQTLQGNHWTAKRVEGAYAVSIEDRASILDALTGFITSQKIQAGQVTGIGATNEATLRFFDPSSKKYVDKTFNEQMEISNLSGNISQAEGKFCYICILRSAERTTLPWLDTYWTLKFAEPANSSFTR